MKNKKLLALTLATAFLAACGGGGGGSSGTTTPPPATTDLTISGTAATGQAIAGAIINAKCQAGTGTATTNADGSYSLLVAGGKLPCVLQITNPADGTKLHTVATGSGASATANITPLTEMLAARVLRNEPAVFFAAFDAAVAASTVTTAAVSAAQTDVGTILAGTVDTSSLTDFITTTLKAATSGNLSGGDAQDKMLDALRVKISPAQLTQVVTALAKTVSTADIKQVVANLAAVPPTANAGPDQSVVVGTVITLDGSASAAGAGRALTYTWTLTSKPTGSSATLASPTSAKPTLTADVAGTYAASVVVNDGLVNSSADAISITASVTNAAPVANAGVAQNVVAGSVVTLDGSASSDANSDPLTYVWTLTSKPAGSTAALSSTTSAKPTFTADVAGTYVASVVVNDGKVNSTPATVSIKAAVANVAPVANAGVAQNVVAGSVVTLDGSASSDANNDPLTYAWTLSSKPAGSTAALASATSAKPTFTADAAGTYVATVIVNDGKVNSSATTVSVTAAVLNVAPVANAGVAQNVVASSVVTLDGSASSDANSDPLTYVWTLTSKPTGSTAALASATSAKPTFTADAAGTYVATVIVNDGKVNSSAATVSITAAVLNIAPVANPGAAQKVVPGVTLSLDGSASMDANGDSLTYVWTLTSIPSGSGAVLTSANTAKPSFTADIAGTYVATLVVSDGQSNSTSKTVAITAVSDLSQLFGTGSSKSTSSFNGVLQGGSQFSSSITNNSSETFALTKYELQNGGSIVSSSVDMTLLSGGDLTPAESVGLASKLLVGAVDNGFRSVYYLTLTRTGQQFTVAVNYF